MDGPNRKATPPRGERWRWVCTERGEGRQQKHHLQTYLLEDIFLCRHYFFVEFIKKKRWIDHNEMDGPNRKATPPRGERWRWVCTERGESRQQKYHLQTYLLEGIYFFWRHYFFVEFIKKNKCIDHKNEMDGPRRNRKGTLPREERWRWVCTVCTERGEARQQKYHLQSGYCLK